jgi:hypothetical protein
MFATVLLMAGVVAVAVADPALPTLPSQYTVKDISIEMFTNAGYPPHYTETDSAQYFDLAAQKQRTDVSESSYGTKAPYTMYKDFTETFPVDCGKMGGTIQAPRGYLVQQGKCCFVPLTQDCPPSQGAIPTAQTMYAPAMPKKIAYEGVVNSDLVANGAQADLWESEIMLKQSVPFMTNDFYFDTSDHETQLANGFYLLLEGANQYINATTTYTQGKDGWDFGSIDASVFDVSSYDCSMQCSQSAEVSNFETNPHFLAQKLMKKPVETSYKAAAPKAVKASTCEAITDESTCMSSMEGSEACAWCSSGAVGTSCQTASDAQSLPAAVFACEYQSAYAAYPTEKKAVKAAAAPVKADDCSMCTNNGPCAMCVLCENTKTGDCAACWSSDNAAGKSCMPACETCWAKKTYAAAAPKAVKGSTCETITDESKCMSSMEGSEACAWCSSGAVGTSCQTATDAKSLPSAVFECEYQKAYAAY